MEEILPRGLYRRKDSNLIWMRYAYKGGIVRCSSGTDDPKLAEMRLNEIKLKIFKKEKFGIVEIQYTYSQMWEKFQNEYALKKDHNTQMMYKYANLHLEKSFGKKNINDITDADVTSYMSGRLREGAKPATINREFSTLSVMMNLAYRKWKWIQANPCSLCQKLKEDNIKVMFIRKDEEKLLLERCGELLNNDLRDIVIFALNTGARESEILHLEWDHVDFEHKTVTLMSTKNGEVRTLPLSRTLLVVLNGRYKEGNRGLVFKTKNGTVYKRRNLIRAFSEARDKAEITNSFTFHGLRHTFGTRLARAGKNIRQIGEIMGIKSEKVLKRYTHFDVESLRNLVDIDTESELENGS